MRDPRDHILDSIRHYQKVTQGGGPGLEVLVGMIGSGKSTYARHRASAGAVVVCHDSIVQTLHPGAKYNSLLKPAYHALEYVAAKTAILCGNRVVIDRTNLTRASRERWIELGKELECRVVAIKFPVSEFIEDHAERRFKDDPRGLSLGAWTQIAMDHARQAERSPLSEREGFDAIIEPDMTAERLSDPIAAFGDPWKPCDPPHSFLD